MKKKLYHYTGGTNYNVFDVIEGGSAIVIKDEHGISTFCCPTCDVKDKINMLLEGQSGTVCFHEQPVSIEVVGTPDCC